jgi:hypothetical protein
MHAGVGNLWQHTGLTTFKGSVNRDQRDLLSHGYMVFVPAL